MPVQLPPFQKEPIPLELNLPKLDTAQGNILTAIGSALFPLKKSGTMGLAYSDQICSDALYALRNGANDIAKEILNLVERSKGSRDEQIMAQVKEIMKKLFDAQTKAAEIAAELAREQAAVTPAK